MLDKCKFYFEVGDDVYKIFFDVHCSYASEDECIIDVDGELLLEDGLGSLHETNVLSPVDLKRLNTEVDNWLDNEQQTNGDMYYQDYLERAGDRMYDEMKEG